MWHCLAADRFFSLLLTRSLPRSLNESSTSWENRVSKNTNCSGELIRLPDTGGTISFWPAHRLRCSNVSRTIFRVLFGNGDAKSVERLCPIGSGNGRAPLVQCSSTYVRDM